jgi:hypothetical protein
VLPPNMPLPLVPPLSLLLLLPPLRILVDESGDC